jgi:hypothetical protein
MIPNLSGAALWLSNSVELSLVAKATLILLAGLAVTAVARNARASARHLDRDVVHRARGLPLLIAFVPRWRSMCRSPKSRSRRNSNRRRVAPRGQERADCLQHGRGSCLVCCNGRGSLVAPASFVFLIPVVSALWRLSMIRRTGLPVAWHRAELARLADARGVSLPVELLEHEAVPGPMTFGISRPVIVLPSTRESGPRPSCGAR